MISLIFYGLGLVLLIEGLVYVLAPHFVEKMLITLQEMPKEQRRLVGACMALVLSLIHI